MPNSAPPSRIGELDGLRAIAVLAVIAFHYTIHSAWANPVTGLGWAGVDLFFVLSGFLITSILLASRGKPRYFSTFYARRTLRIFPIYYCLLAVYVLSALLFGGPQPWLYWTMHMLYLSSVVQFFHAWLFPAPPFVYAGLAVLWSLSVEELFYLLWAPIVRFLPQRRLWIVLALAIVSAPLLRWHLHTHAFPEYEFFPARFDSLAWGAALALLLRRRERLPARLSAWLCGTTLLAGGLFLALAASTGSGRGNVWIATCGFSLLAVAFAGWIGWTVLRAGSGAPLCRLLRLPPARALGTVSYTAYLVHYPVLTLVAAAGAAWLGRDLGATPAGVLLRDSLSLVFALLLASASWRWLESPILRLKDRWRPATGRVGELAGASLRTVRTAGNLS